ncbi:MAG: dihydroneopterin aldolase [Balneolaceae bacterium]
MDRITLKSLAFHAKHGHNKQERIDGNRFEVDVIAFGHFRRAVPDEDLTKTFDYATAEEIVRGVMTGESRKLIETLCTDIGDTIFNTSQAVLRLRVSVRKLSPPVETSAAYSEITMEWNR